jgi:(p)ppGpp synthase/HD superfamily hydrolase
MFPYTDLREKLAEYLSLEQVEQISEAYALAERAHAGQRRYTGEPYITHPLEVARILANMHLDAETIMAAILHDVIEDSSFSKADIAEKFGDKVADLVDGVSKLTQIEFNNKEEAQA